MLKIDFGPAGDVVVIAGRLDAAQAGSADAFLQGVSGTVVLDCTDLVVRYQRPLYNAAFWIVRNPEDARDVTQTAFLKAAEGLAEFDGRHRFFSWIYRIAVNEALNWIRQNGRDDSLDDDFDTA